MVPFSFQTLYHIIGVMNFPVEAYISRGMERPKTFSEVAWI